MLHGDILVLHGGGLLLGGGEGAVHVLGHVHLVGLPAAAGHLGQLVHQVGGGRLEARHRHTHGGEQLGNKALLVADQSQQQVLLLDLLVAVGLGDVLSPLDGGQRLLGKLIHIHSKKPSFSWGLMFWKFSTLIN